MNQCLRFSQTSLCNFQEGSMTKTSVNRNERYKQPTIHSKLSSHFQDLYDPISLAVNAFLLHCYYGIAEALFSLETRKMYHLHLEDFASHTNNSQPVML